MGEFIRTETAKANSDPTIARDPGAFRLRSKPSSKNGLSSHCQKKQHTQASNEQINRDKRQFLLSSQ